MDESLVELSAAFAEWRSRKRHAREAAPADLMKRACAAVRRHGPTAVARATKIRADRLTIGPIGRRSRRRVVPAASVPTFSRIEIAAPSGPVRPFAEVEMPTGLKVRLFTQTDEAFGLLSSLLVAAGAR
jgi:hypothetical protein